MKQISLKELKNIVNTTSVPDKNVEVSVKTIIDSVRQDGDKALLSLTKKFDGIDLQSIKIPISEINEAEKNLDVRLKKSIMVVIKRVEKYHKNQLPSDFKIKEKGLTLEYKFSPIEKVGVYVPAGQSPLLSTLIMTCVPAIVAGVKKIYVASPPTSNKKIHPSILGTLGLLGLKDIFAMGGAQAVAAFAYGTETVPQVDLVTGPGNKYVDTAKKLLYGTVGIDLPAGPSEVAIFADSSADIDFVKKDLLAQGEHTDSKVFLITTSEQLGNKISASVKTGFWMHVKTKKEALNIINLISPEHLQVMCKNPEEISTQAIAGTILLGNYSPAALGDYFAGPSHVLPTGRTARFASGLSVYTFLRKYAVIKAEQSFYDNNQEPMRTIANTEGLVYHSESLSARSKRKNNE